MIRRRLAALALTLATFAGCHEDPNVQQVIVPGAATALAILTDGGTGSTPTNSAGTGSKGGNLRARVVGELNLGGSTTLTSPTVPTAPTTGNAPLTSPTTGTPGSTTGTVIISGNVTVDTLTSPATFQTSNGDIVVSGTLRTAIAGGTQNTLNFSAPAGTVYITGSVITSSSDGTASGDFGGDVDITAARIVITGTIDTRGENGTTTGGKGGNVTMTSTAGPIIVTGSILTSGGTGNSAGTGTTAGAGGFVSLLSATAMQIFGTVTTDGGEATETSAKPVGGKGGDITLSASSSIDISSTIHQRGGDANGDTFGADGGQGGKFLIGDTIPVKIYGTLDVRGGTATANSKGASTLVGGLGGDIDLGDTGSDLESLELGRGTWSTIGGSGVEAVGAGGDIDLRTVDGTVSLGSDLDTHGGRATGSAAVTGGKGGDVTIMGDSAAGAQSNHPLIANFLASVTTTGGAGTGAGNGGVGGKVILQTGGDITLPIAITTTGGDAVDGTGGTGGEIDITVDNLGVPNPVGDILMTGVLTALGGTSSNGPGGTGGKVVVDTTLASVGEITSSANISTSGTLGRTGAAAGGAPGTIEFKTEMGSIALSGTLNASGGDSIAAPASATTIFVTAGASGGGITSSATIVANGGSSTAAAPVGGGNGGDIQFKVLNATGTIQLDSATRITANGGTGSGSSAGGTGGLLTLQTLDQAVSISGTIVTLGGIQNGTGSGGLGGQVLVNSDSDGINAKGDITLTVNSSIDVSSGTGPGGGSARNSGAGPADPGVDATIIAVIFDADGGLANEPDSANGGIVRNLGRIVARGRGTGGHGGDIWFDGRSSSGGELSSPADDGFQDRTGATAPLNGIFYPN